MFFAFQLHFLITHHEELNCTKTLSLLHFPSIFHFFCLPSFLFLSYLSPRLSSHFPTIRDGLKLHRSPLTSWPGEMWVGTYYCLFLCSIFSSPLLGGNYTNIWFTPFPITQPELSDGSQQFSSPFSSCFLARSI